MGLCISLYKHKQIVSNFEKEIDELTALLHDAEIAYQNDLAWYKSKLIGIDSKNDEIKKQLCIQDQKYNRLMDAYQMLQEKYSAIVNSKS